MDRLETGVILPEKNAGNIEFFIQNGILAVSYDDGVIEEVVSDGGD